MQNCNARKAVVLLQQTGPAVWLEFDFENELAEKGYVENQETHTSEPEQTCDNKINSSSLSKSPANNKSSINHPYLLSYINTCINNKKFSCIYFMKSTRTRSIFSNDFTLKTGK